MDGVRSRQFETVVGVVRAVRTWVHEDKAWYGAVEVEGDTLWKNRVWRQTTVTLHYM
jgi:hypothetical protein